MGYLSIPFACREFAADIVTFITHDKNGMVGKVNSQIWFFFLLDRREITVLGSSVLDYQWSR